jgi:hypothetical protein
MPDLSKQPCVDPVLGLLFSGAPGVGLTVSPGEEFRGAWSVEAAPCGSWFLRRPVLGLLFSGAPGVGLTVSPGEEFRSDPHQDAQASAEQLEPAGILS